MAVILALSFTYLGRFQIFPPERRHNGCKLPRRVSRSVIFLFSELVMVVLMAVVCCLSCAHAVWVAAVWRRGCCCSRDFDRRAGTVQQPAYNKQSKRPKDTSTDTQTFFNWIIFVSYCLWARCFPTDFCTLVYLLSLYVDVYLWNNTKQWPFWGP